jgi:hypothetical protein
MVAVLLVCRKVACDCSVVHALLPASGHACTGHGAHEGLYGSMAPPAAQAAAWPCA